MKIRTITSSSSRFLKRYSSLLKNIFEPDDNMNKATCIGARYREVDTHRLNIVGTLNFLSSSPFLKIIFDQSLQTGNLLPDDCVEANVAPIFKKGDRHSPANQFIQNFESKTQTGVVVLDFSKAFDVVTHQRLLHKLDQHGIRGTTLNWIQHFLNNRTQAKK